MNKGLTAKQFREAVTSAFGERENVFFSQQAQGYYASYQPKYPEKSAGDFLISYGIFSGKLTISAETDVVPTVREFESLEELTEAIKGMDY